MKRDNKEIDTNNKLDVMIRTHRGRIGTVLVILGLYLFLKSEMNFLGLVVFWFIGIALISSVGVNARVAKDDEIKEQKKDIKKAATKCIGDYLYVNENDQTWCAPSVSPRQYSFSELLDYSVVENGDDVVGGSLLGTAVGAMGGGLTGALLGATASKVSSVCSDLGIKISVNDIDTPIIYISLISSEVNKKWDQYKKAAANAEEIAGVLAVIKARNKN